MKTHTRIATLLVMTVYCVTSGYQETVDSFENTLEFRNEYIWSDSFGETKLTLVGQGLAVIENRPGQPSSLRIIREFNGVQVYDTVFKSKPNEPKLTFVHSSIKFFDIAKDGVLEFFAVTYGEQENRIILHTVFRNRMRHLRFEYIFDEKLMLNRLLATEQEFGKTLDYVGISSRELQELYEYVNMMIPN